MKHLIKFAMAVMVFAAAPAFAKCIYEEKHGDHSDNPDSCYLFGKRSGLWELRFADGRVESGPMVQGNGHGRWEIRTANGDFTAGPTVHGKKHGQWEERFANGTVAIGPYVDHQMHGQWQAQWADSQVSCHTYEKGKEVSSTTGPCN